MNTAETLRPWNTWSHVAHFFAYHLKVRVTVESRVVNMSDFEDQLLAQ